MPVHGPCKVPGCIAPTKSSGQWQYIPEEFCIEHVLEFGEDCTCKKARCLRMVGLKDPVQPPGCKRKAGGGGGESPSIDEMDELPRPPIIVSIDEIWAERCAASRPPACSRLPACRLTVAFARRARG